MNKLTWGWMLLPFYIEVDDIIEKMFQEYCFNRLERELAVLSTLTLSDVLVYIRHVFFDIMYSVGFTDSCCNFVYSFRLLILVWRSCPYLQVLIVDPDWILQVSELTMETNKAMKILNFNPHKSTFECILISSLLFAVQGRDPLLWKKFGIWNIVFYQCSYGTVSNFDLWCFIRQCR